MDRKEELKQWIDLADNNLRTAEHIAETMRPTPDEIICNQCHQATEKYLKGYLFVNDVEPPKTHSLISLLKMCSEYSQDFIEYSKQCNFLNKFGVLPRYPNELQIEEDEMIAAIRFAKAVKEFVLSKIKEFKK
jgi:HEPN domain-containing protein